MADPQVMFRQILEVENHQQAHNQIGTLSNKDSKGPDVHKYIEHLCLFPLLSILSIFKACKNSIIHIHSCACIEPIQAHVYTLGKCEHHVFIGAQSCCNASKSFNFDLHFHSMLSVLFHTTRKIPTNKKIKHTYSMHL